MSHSHPYAAQRRHGPGSSNLPPAASPPSPAYDAQAQAHTQTQTQALPSSQPSSSLLYRSPSASASAGPLPASTTPGFSGHRAHQPPIPPALTTSGRRIVTAPTALSPLSPRHDAYRGTDPRLDGGSRSAATDRTTFYSDSSSAPSPEPQSPKLSSPTHPNDTTRSVSDPIATPRRANPPVPLETSPKAAMSGPPPASAHDAESALPRNPSIDSAISAVSAKAPTQDASQHAAASGSADVAGMIAKAGSPEALIQSLLRDKHSQAQQNSQLWRLVDKQRAMILGLNKDLERALKDKEKYRTKLKDMMANPAVSKAAGLVPGSTEPSSHSRPSVPKIDVQHANESAARAPDSPASPMSESDGQRNSPIDTVIAPYPITPPSDHTTSQITSAIPETPQAMPKPQEHAFAKYDHEAEERAADQARKEKEKTDDPMRDLHFNTSLPPSRGLPPDPPKGPPPKPPMRSPPPISVAATSPSVDQGFSSFPAPPRKGPPAPLQLRQDVPDPAQDEDDTDSELDEILDVASDRGRRRTRAEDDRDRESPDVSPPSPRAAPPQVAPQSLQAEAATTSLDGVIQRQQVSWDPNSGVASGLPMSPRPTAGMRSPPLQSPPLSPRGAAAGSFAAAPLSPRPPRQPIPLPPNTPLAGPLVPSAGDSAQPKQQPRAGMPENVVEQQVSADAGAKTRSSPTERTRVFKGLVTEEYPELLLPPNALPSIAIQVASSRMKPSRASIISLTQMEEDPVFTLAVISRSDGGELWRVEKDIASLGKLDSRLRQCAAFTAPAPDRSLFSGHAPAKVDARRVALEIYMDDVLNTPLDTATALDLCKYLSTNTLPPNADETGASASASGEGSGHMIGPDGRPIRSGYLTKRGKNFGGWKSRFFLLDGPFLKYYETPGGAHLGIIKLQSAQIGKQSQTSDGQSPTPGSGSANGEDMESQYRHAFLILEPKKKDSSSHVKHVLCAESDKERDLWVDALLQWIDYRDPDDADAPSTKTNGSSKSASSRNGNTTAAPNAKPKKGSGGQSRANHQGSDSDTLVGVRYGSTQAGEAPQTTTPAGRPKTSAGPNDHAGFGADTMSSQPKIISGPKDPQPISDTAAWGNKSGLGAPSHEEKKARKRSFFGFGPKMHSDGQDSNSSGDPSGSTPPPGYHGGSHQVFGAQLAEAVRFNPPVDVDVPLPSVVYRCIQYLDAKNAVREEGIFRLSGSNVVIKQVRERFNTEGDVNLLTDDQYYDIHAIASLLKLYLRELPTTILTRDLHMEFLGTLEMQDRDEKLTALNGLAQRLPLPNATLLKYLISFLIKIINNADQNKMTVRNVGIVFSPTLNIPAPVFAMLLQNYEPIFGIAPEDYQLPTASGEEAHGRFEPPPGRPSPSSGASSPHRQPRVDSVREHSRSTPTPPLMSNVHAPRGSPTPTEQSTSSHQAPSTASAGQRPPYENMHGQPPPPQGEGYNLYPSSARQAPAYDRMQYQQPGYGEHSPAVQEPQGYYPSSNAKRRESSMYMGHMGLQSQGSRSRLREETRYQ